MRSRKRVSRAIDRTVSYQKSTLEGIIIYVDSTYGWCNVELANGDILYHIKFGEGVSARLRRVEQPVTLIQTIGSKYAYIIVGAAKRKIASSEFEDKGTFAWDDGTKWNDGHQWK